MANKQRQAPLYIRVLVSEQNGQWLAEGLEYHLTTQAPSSRQAINSFVRILRRRMELDTQHGREPLANLSPAPDHVWDAWKQMERLTEELLTYPVSPVMDGVPEAYVIHESARTNDTGLNT